MYMWERNKCALLLTQMLSINRWQAAFYGKSIAESSLKELCNAKRRARRSKVPSHIKCIPLVTADIN
jgi:hypothetical protein